MTEHRFDGRVAIVTGAGRGIGRAHALLLAARGAQVVVNDLGGAMEGGGSSASVAAEVVAEIVGRGGEAVADTHDVSSVDGAEALIDAAHSTFGGLDVLVNNAGIIRWAEFPAADFQNLADHLAVHVAGSFNTSRAAWPRMVEQGYGRIVMTTSSGIFGLRNNAAYAAAKAGIIGLTRSLADAGLRLGIKVNAVAPAAATRMAGNFDASAMAADFVAPMVAFLAHEDCPVTGSVYAAGAGRFTKLFIASTEGWVGKEPSVEDVADNWAAINDEAGYYVPASLREWSAAFMDHLE